MAESQKHVERRFAYCAVGWYFDPPFYVALSARADGELFVVSHRPAKKIPPSIRRLIAEDRLLVRRNIGYDWGAYQQFLETGLWRDYEAIVFLHDDIELNPTAFVEKLATLLTEHAVVGNGRLSLNSIVAGDNPQSYAFAREIPASPKYRFEAVRGSFFAIRCDALEKLGRFEVFWDPFRIDCGLGNWSTRASCAKLQRLMGANCFGFLSETYRESDAILELERGGKGVSPLNSAWKRFLYGRLLDSSRKLTALRWKASLNIADRIRRKCLSVNVGLFSGRWIR